MQVEAGMHPPTQHSCALRREEPLVHEEGDDPRAEQLFQRLQAHLRQHVEQPVGDTGVQMRVPVEVFAKGVDRHDDAGQALGQVQRGAEVFEEALVRDGAEVFEQVAVIAEVWAQHLGNAEGEVAVRHRKEDRLAQQRPKELHLLLVPRRAEPAPLADELKVSITRKDRRRWQRDLEPRQWVQEMVQVTMRIYPQLNWPDDGDFRELPANYYELNIEKVEEQLEIAGVRLAPLLNRMFE